MNDPSAYDDAARPDESPFIETPDDLSPGARPGGLSAICVLTIILASLGLFTGCIGVASQATESRMRQVVATMQEKGDQPAAKIQREFNERIFAITDRYRWATLPLAIAKIAVEIGLLAGAIVCLRLDRRGGTWLKRALVCTIVVEALHVVPVVLIQNETREAMTEMMSKTMAAGGGGNPPPAGVQGFATAFGSIIGVLAIAWAVGWLVAKIIFYVIAIRYLRKPETVRLFAPPPDEPSAGLA